VTGSLAAGDCERLRDGLLGQPVNAASSLAYLVVAAWLLGRGVGGGPGRREPATVAFGVAVAWTGAGSLDFHGPATPAARFLHDAGLVSVVLFVAAADLARLAGRPERAPAVWAGATAAASGLLGLVPAAGGAVTGLAGVAAAAGEVAVGRRGLRPAGRRAVYRAGLAALAGGAAGWALGRSGGPLCDPDGVLQPHALWHLATAAALAAWARVNLNL
jgi:hypothetical protein